MLTDVTNATVEDEAQALLGARFGLSSFRPGQREVPGRFTRQQTYRGIKTLVRMQSRSTTKQNCIEWQIEQLPRGLLRDVQRFVIETVGDVFHARSITCWISRILALHIERVNRYVFEDPETAHDDVGSADWPAHRHAR